MELKVGGRRRGQAYSGPVASAETESIQKKIHQFLVADATKSNLDTRIITIKGKRILRIPLI